jgi:hypothetical protein
VTLGTYVIKQLSNRLSHAEKPAWIQRRSATPEKEKPGYASAFSRAERLLIKKELTFLSDRRTAMETPA